MDLKMAHGNAKTDIKIGDIFEEWEVIGAPTIQHNKTVHLCRCSCGVTRFVIASVLRTRRSKRCSACRNIKMKTNPPAYKDGGKHRRLRRCWADMLSRCYNPNDRAFNRYGKRGIIVCVNWWEFSTFKIWALSHGYSNNLTIDRINGNKSYSPLNCRWATNTQQARNKKNNHYYTAFGETKLLPEWMEDVRCIVSFSTLDNRINRDKWNTEHALTFPKNSGSTYEHMKRRYLTK